MDTWKFYISFSVPLNINVFTSSVANTKLMYFIIVLAEVSVSSLKSNLRMIQSVVTVWLYISVFN